MELILQYVLPSILGDFVLGIDKNHMKTNLLSGRVSLDGVTLNPDIIKSLNLPMKIVYSNIGHFEIMIPWLQRLKQPMEIFLDDLFIVLEQNTSADYFDFVTERVKFLDALLQEIRNKLKKLNTNQPKEESSMDYYKVLILDNLQVTIRNIHVRFENPKKGYAFGLTLDEVYMRTINEKGQPEFLDRTLEENKMRDLCKRLVVQDISLYWNANENSTAFIGTSSLTNDQKKVFMKNSILRKGSNPQSFQPILSLSLESHLILKNVNKEELDKDPRYRLEIDLKPINVTLDNEQVSQMVSLMNFINKAEKERKREFKKIQLTAIENQAESMLYRKTLTDFLLSIEEPEFKWSEELRNPKKKALSDQLKSHLSKLSNETLATVSREVFIKDEKRRLLIKMESKIVKKGIMSAFKSELDEKKEHEELRKLANYFDAFIQENEDRIGKNLKKGFVFEVNLRLSEASFFLMDAKSIEQQGLLLMVNSTRLKLQYHNHEDYDLGRVEFLINDIKLSLQKGALTESSHREVVVLTKYDTDNKQDFASLLFEMKSFSEGNKKFDLKGNLQGTELTYVPELIIGARKFINFEKDREEENAIDIAYEKMSDMSKNAQEQLKSVLNDYSSNVTISLTWDLFHAIVPLNPSAGKSSDSWILAVNGFKVYTDPDKSDNQIEAYDKFKLELNSINMKYFEKVSHYFNQKKNNNLSDEEKAIFPLMEDTKILTELRILRRMLKWKSDENAEFILNFYIGNIVVNFNSLFYRKILEVKNCFDFSQEKDLNEYLETEKNSILQNNDGAFIVYYRDDNDKIATGWEEYTMITAGFYLYFYKNQNDVEPTKHFFTKQAKIKVEKEAFDFPHILKLKNKFEEIVIAFDSENSLNTLMETLIRRNREYREENLLISIKEKDLESVTKKKEKEENHKNVLLKLNVVFEGLHLELFEQFETKLNKVSLSKLGIEYCFKAFDQTLKVQLTSISIIDYTLKFESDQPIQILSSQSDANNSSENQNDLIKIDARFLLDRHPDFKKNLNEKEVTLLFNSLFINYIPERIYFLIDFFVSPISLGANELNAMRRDSVSSHKSSVDMSTEISSPGKQYIAKKTENKEEVKFVVGVVKVNELSLTLFTQISHIKLAKATLQNFSTDISVDKNAFNCKGSLKNMQIFDFTNYQLDPSITEIIPNELIGIEKGSSVLEFEFIQRHEGYMKQLQTDIENIIKIDINSIRINYMSQPLMRIINYFVNFIVDFSFAEIDSFEKKLGVAIRKTKKPKFNSITVALNSPKVLLKAKPHSQIFFELELDKITVQNRTSKNTERILQKIPTLESVFSEIYNIETSDITLIKKTNEGNSVWLSNPFKLNLDFERCLWYEEYILSYQIAQEEKFKILDNGFYLKGNTTPVFLKFNQEDYLDIMDAVNFNLAFEDMKDSLYHIESEGLQELSKIKEPIPLNVNLMFEYIAAVTMDQITHNPLSKALALSTSIGFNRTRKNDKNVKIIINKLIAMYYEKKLESDQYTEKTLVGHTYIERETPMKDEDSVKEIFNPDVIEQERKELENEIETVVKIDYKMHANQDKELVLSIKQLKCFLNVPILLRVKDFFNIDDAQENKKNEIQWDFGYKFKTHYKVIIDKAEISVPHTESTALVIKSAVVLDFIKYDVIDILKEKEEFLESSQLNFTITKSEVFIYNENSVSGPNNIQKRNIVLPLSVMYKSKEHLSYESTNNKLLAQRDNLCAFDKVVLKLSSTDSMLFVAIMMRLEQEFKQYKSIPEFNSKSREVLLQNTTTNDEDNLGQITVIKEKNRIVHDGIQIRVINDLSGVAIPLLDFSLHSCYNNSAILLEKTLHLLHGKNTFQVSSSFYNSKVGKWEPIIEKWEFDLELELGEVTEYKKKVDITNSHQDALNINISDEMLRVILLAWRDWNESFVKTKAPNDSSLPSLQRSNSSLKMLTSINKKEDNNIEHVSPFTIWNDTGYPLHIEPYLAGTHLNGISCTHKMDLKPGQKQDLIMDWSIERIFESSTKESTLERLQVTAWIEHPTFGAIEIPNIDIHNFGVKKRRLAVKELTRTFPFICDVFTHDKKKLVRFSSPILIRNSMPKPIYIQIYENREKPTRVFVNSNETISLPFDLTSEPISFHMGFVPDNKQKLQLFKVDSLYKNPPSGIMLGINYASLRPELFSTHAIIHFEPLITLKNCLPFPLSLRLEGNSKEFSRGFDRVLETQEEVILTEFSPDFDVKLSCTTENFVSNKYTLIPFNNQANQTLYFQYRGLLVPLNVQCVELPNRTYKFIISSKTLILNESKENLSFLGIYEASSFISPFIVPIQNENECVLFSETPAIKILPKSEGSSPSEPIPLNQLGSFPVDVYDGQKQALNLGVHIRNILCDKEQTIFTKIISILPRYVILNQTEHVVSFYQPEDPNKTIEINPGERSSFNFSKSTESKLINMKIHTEEGQQEWKESGTIDISSPGNVNFICFNSNHSQEKYLNMAISLQDASLFITLQEQSPSEAIIQIKNNLKEYTLLVNQKEISDHKYTVAPSTTSPFAWVKPSSNNIIMARLALGEDTSVEFECKIAEINQITPYMMTIGQKNITIFLRIVLVGRSQILEFSIEKEERKERKTDRINLLFRVNLPALGLSLISSSNNRKFELSYISLTPLLFALVDREGVTSIQLRIKSIMFDNNFQKDTPYPVTIFAHNAKVLKEKDLPHFDFICNVKNKQKDSDILYIHELGFYLAKTCISLDGHTINAISDFVRNINGVLKKSVYSETEYSQYIFLSEKEKKDLEKSYSQNKSVCTSWQNFDPASSSKEFIYIEKLEIQPIMLNITFKNPQFDFKGAFVFNYIKNALGKALANLDNVPINLSGITLTSLYGTQDQAIGGLVERYKELGKNSILKIIFSANIIGNPVKFFNKISSGVDDLIDKPAKGFLEGPLEGGIGIVGGVSSLAAKTVGATFNSLHSITDSLANGLSNLSGDQDYIQDREQTNAKKNLNLLTGSMQAVSSIGKGLFGGITGVIEKPIQGASQGGFGGFMKGMYLGAKGLAIKPVAGVLDGVSKLTEGVSNSLDKDANLLIAKSRLPRVFYGKEKIYQIYNIDHVNIMNFIQKNKPEKYSNLTVLEISFLDLVGNKASQAQSSHCLVLTLERVFLISLEKASIVWKFKSANMKKVSNLDEKIEIILKKPTNSLKQQIAVLACKNNVKKTEIYNLLNILREIVEDML